MAKVYNVSYDLKKSGQNYDGLIEELKKSPSWWHYLGSTWLIKTDESPGQLWARLEPFMDDNDRMLIIQVCDNRAGWLTQEAWDWITQNVPNC